MALTPLTNKFAKKIRELSWIEIHLAIERKWLNLSYAVDKAMEIVLRDQYTQDELLLATLGYDQKNDIIEILNRITSSTYHEELNADKWSKILLTWLFMEMETYEDPLLEIELIYADLGYPDKMAHLVRYMPSEAARDLFLEWENYVTDNDYLN